MGLARKRQVKVVERTIRLDELRDASEVFLAGTAAEVTPVREIAGIAYTPGDLTRMLMTDYEALVRLSPEQVAQGGI
jgi:branched-chain amino acid aminotransferase